MSSAKISAAETWSAAEEVLGRLREAGLHPLELSVAMPLAAQGAKEKFPIEVPVAEADVARELVAALAGAGK